MTQEAIPPERELSELRDKAKTLERLLAAAKQDADSRLIRAELKAEAVRAGMVDLDGLKLLDLSAAKLNANGEVDDAAVLMDQFKRAKPWLFGSHSSSSTATAPQAQPPQQKSAKQMSEAEYRAARAELLKRGL